jgi:ankyrin repeat protein
MGGAAGSGMARKKSSKVTLVGVSGLPADEMGLTGFEAFQAMVSDTAEGFALRMKHAKAKMRSIELVMSDAARLETMRAVADAFAQLLSSEKATRERAKAALDAAKFFDTDGLAVAALAALSVKDKTALTAVAQADPAGFAQMRVPREGRQRGVAQAAIELAALGGKADESCEMLREAVRLGADLWAKASNKTDALFAAIENENVAAVRCVLELTPDAKKRLRTSQRDGDSAAGCAARTGVVELLQALIDAGAPLEGADGVGRTPLGYAAGSGSAPCVAALLKAGAKINETDSVGWTALMVASDEGETDAARLLLAQGADANARDPKGESALTLAIRNGNVEMASILAPRTKLGERNQKGESAIDVAARCEFWEGFDALFSQSGEQEALAAVFAFARKTMPKTVGMAERGLLLDATSAPGEAKESQDEKGEKKKTKKGRAARI